MNDDRAPQGIIRRTGAAQWLAFKQLGSGLGTASLALATLGWIVLVALACLVGVGLLFVPSALWALHWVADLERRRLTHWGPEVLGPGPLPTGVRAAAADPTTRRELRWLAGHATLGLLLGAAGVQLPIWVIRDLSFPLWWRFVPEADAVASLGFWRVHDWPGVSSVVLLGLCWAAFLIGFAPGMARLQAWGGRRLLAPLPGTDLALRVVQLTATRAAALDAHAAELRRIERSLHDGTQNRLVAVTVLLGAARRMVTRDPEGADAVLERAQGAAEQALAELRAVARGILPPVLADRGLEGALGSLAASCAVPCHVDIEMPGRCAVSVEATAYFVVAEALTNIAKHSGASRAEVVIRRHDGQLRARVTDDGRGGADEHGGSGLAGMRGRVEAHDGTLTLTSPPGGPTTLEMELPCGS